MKSSSIVAGAVAAAAAALYLAVSLTALGTVPPVHEDEPWQASVGWKLAHDGVLGSDLFAGFFGMERRYYAFMPVHPMLEAAVFRIAGVGLAQARLVTVGLGLLLLAATGVAALLLFDPPAAAAAVASLVLVRWGAQDVYHVTGIPLLDGARVARYDMAAATFGMAALVAYLMARRRGGWEWHAVAGVMIAAAGLSHLYGFFWLPALVLVALLNRERPRRVAALAAGCVAGVLPWVAYALSDLGSFLAQTWQYGARFSLLDPGFYLGNVLREPWRYGAGRLIHPFASPSPGLWLALGGVPAAVTLLGWRGVRRRDPAAMTVACAGIILAGLMALLISRKSPSYLLLVTPVAAIALGWGAVSLWRAAGGRWVVRAGLVALGMAAAVEGLWSLRSIPLEATEATPYPALAKRLRVEIPAGSRVLVLHRYWFGLEDLDVRSWWVPLALADPEISPQPRDLAASLAAISPDVVILDEDMREEIRERPPARRAITRFLSQGRFETVASISDPTYGTLQVLRRRSP